MMTSCFYNASARSPHSPHFLTACYFIDSWNSAQLHSVQTGCFLFPLCLVHYFLFFIRNKNVPLRLTVRGLDNMFLFTLFVLHCLFKDIETWQILWQIGGKEWNLQMLKCWNHSNCCKSDESQPLSKVFLDVGGTVESWCVIWESWVLTVSLARLIGNVQKNRVDLKNKRLTQFQCDIGILWGNLANLHFKKKDCVWVSKRTLCVIFFCVRDINM